MENLDAYKFDYDPYTVPKDPAALENAIENTVGDGAGSKKDNYTRPNVSTDLEIENGNPDIDTHLIKNTEWGALAYYINHIHHKQYLLLKDPELSTTGTVYGVYDLCNTNYEYIAAATKSFANNKTALNKILDNYNCLGDNCLDLYSFIEDYKQDNKSKFEEKDTEIIMKASSNIENIYIKEWLVNFLRYEILPLFFLVYKYQV